MERSHDRRQFRQPFALHRADLLRTDCFWEFFASRAETLLQRIEAATGKTVAREPELFRAGVVAEAYDEGPEEEWDAEEPLEEAAS